MRRPPNHGAAEPANGATYSFFKKGSWEKILIFFLRAGCPAPVSPLLFAMRLLPYQDTTQLLHARTLDDYGIMALALDLESGSTKNGCVGCQKIKEEELKRKSALRKSMSVSISSRGSQSICKFGQFPCRSSDAPGRNKSGQHQSPNHRSVDFRPHLPLSCFAATCNLSS